jgi:WxL domain surface cell wall-binding
MPRAKLVLRASIVIAAAGAVAGGLPAVAAAETHEDHTTFSVTAGSLTFAEAPALPTLSSVTINGEAQTTDTTMTNFKVKDATGSGSGWHVSVSGHEGSGLRSKFTQYCPEAACGTVGYVASGHELAANSLALNSTGASFEPASNAPSFECSAGCYVDTGNETANKIVSAAEHKGMGSYKAKGWSSESLQLSTPGELYALPAHEVYRVDVLWTLSSGP